MTYYEDPLVTLLHGDCIEVMATLPADSVDAVVTDPPYGLEFMGKAWDTKQGFGQWCLAWGVEALRVTKPGGYLLAFGGTRTHHRLVCALEDAGWIIRDELTWIYASGFPKGKANLKPAHEPIVLARKPGPLRPLEIDECRIGDGPVQTTTGDALGTWFGDKADSYVKGTGAKFRSASTCATCGHDFTVHEADDGLTGEDGPCMNRPECPCERFTPGVGGRWPSNVLLSDPELFDEPNPYVVGSGATASFSSGGQGEPGTPKGPGWGTLNRDITVGYGDSGGYSRFFIVPKADRAERERGLAEHGKTPREAKYGSVQDARPHTPEGYEYHREARANVHPTVKPIDLMRHLVRLVTPTGGVVLDPFLGSGTTCLAASELGMKSIGIERELEYLEIAKGRMIATPMGMGL